ncbi:hypothetical protein ACOSP7_032112 [Xanthoceras sorbifolium]
MVQISEVRARKLQKGQSCYTNKPQNVTKRSKESRLHSEGGYCKAFGHTNMNTRAKKG